MVQREVGLQEAAKALGVTTRNLGRLLDIAGTQTTPDPRDKRRQVITEAQLQQLLKRFPPAPATNEDLDERFMLLTQQLNALQAQVVSLTSWMTTQSENIGALMTRISTLEQAQESLHAEAAESANMPVGAGASQYRKAARTATGGRVRRAHNVTTKEPGESAVQSRPK
jgi:chromosome segregation ATPase